MKQFIIIGNSAAGIAAMEAIRKNDKQAKITVISDEGYPAYCRCLISYYLASELKEKKIFYRPEDFYKQNNIELILNKKVTRLDPKKSRIICEDKTQFNYDSLLLATGARPKFPDIKGIKKRGVFGFRTLKDAKDIEGLLPVTKSACVLGAGLIGLKAAYALRKRKLGVKVIVKSKQILSQMLDAQAAAMLCARLEENGIEIIFGNDAQEIIGNGDMKAIKLESGKALECSLLIVGKGVEPNINLAEGTDIKINTGILTNNLMQTTLENVFGAGDVSETLDLAKNEPSINALWPVAVEQGRIAGLNMTGANINYEGSVGMNSIEFFGSPAVSLGIFKIKEGSAGYEELKFNDPVSGVYKKIILKDNVVVGAIFTGNIRNSGVFLELIKKRVDVSSLKEKFFDENFGYPLVMDLLRSKENIYV